MPGNKESESQGSGKTNGWWWRLGLPSVCAAAIGAVIWSSMGWINSRASADGLKAVETKAAKELALVKHTCDARELAAAKAVKDLDKKFQKHNIDQREFETRMDTAMAYLVPGYKGKTQ